VKALFLEYNHEYSGWRKIDEQSKPNLIDNNFAGPHFIGLQRRTNFPDFWSLSHQSGWIVVPGRIF
jgi:hypothetical protein